MTGRRPGRPREPVPRENLLAAACRVFDRDGYGAARLADIAREAGISRGALAYHFATKDALYDEVLSGIAGGFHRLVAEALSGRASWEARLDALGDASVAVLGQRPDVARLMLRELVDGGPYVAGPGGAVVDALVDAIVAFLEEGLAAGLVAPQDPRHLAGTIVALHVAWFGAPALTGRLGGTAPDAVAVRSEQVRAQVRRLCGLR
ncbi:MAG: TetR/AcrR family transcriptional regulator [Myxococcota bacterium]